MYIVSQIEATTGLYQRVGHKQPTVADMPTLSAANLVSNSGLYFGGGLTTIQNIYDCQEDSAISDANFNTLLISKQKEAINAMLQKVFNEDDLIENRLLFPYENVMTETLENGTDFVGYEISVSKRKNITTIFNELTATFDAIDAVKLLLFHSSKQDAITSKEITTVANQDVSEAVTDWVLENSTYKGGKYYIGYLTSGLTPKAINREWNESNVQNTFNHVGITPIKVSGWNVETLFDVDDIVYTADTYGLNFDISVHKDFTDPILRNKPKFDNLIQLQFEADMLKLIATSTRTNRIERICDKAYFALYGDTENHITGLEKKLEREIKKLKETFTPKQKLTSYTVK